MERMRNKNRSRGSWKSCVRVSYKVRQKNTFQKRELKREGENVLS